MFSQVFVCTRGPGVSVQRSLSRGVSVQGHSLSRGSVSRGVSVQGHSLSRGLCPGTFSVQEVSVQGGLCPWGSLSGGSLSRGCLSRVFSPRGGLCPETPHPVLLCAGGTHLTGMHSCFFFDLCHCSLQTNVNIKLDSV